MIMCTYVYVYVCVYVYVYVCVYVYVYVYVFGTPHTKKKNTQIVGKLLSLSLVKWEWLYLSTI